MRSNWKNSVLALLLVVTMVLGLTNNVVAAGTGNTKASLTMEEVTDTVAAKVVADKADKSNGMELQSNDEVRVFVVLEGKAVVDYGYSTKGLAANETAMEKADLILTQQEAVAKKISKEALAGEKLDVKYNFTLLANAFSTTVLRSQINRIKEVNGVKDVIEVQQYEALKEGEGVAKPNMGTAGEMVGANQAWKSGYTGAGQRIVVIDTGIDADHPSFDGEAFMYGLKETCAANKKDIKSVKLLTKSEIEKVWKKLHCKKYAKKASEAYLSAKIPFAINYVDENTDITHDNDEQGDHGTHVSGISTANTYVPNNGEFVKQENGVAGVAPDAQLITMKVFGTNGGANEDDYMAGIEDALLLNADSVNLSLGSSSRGFGTPEEAFSQSVFKKIENSDTVVSISAGNSGRWGDDGAYGASLWTDMNLATTGSPGTYTNALTVASAVNSGYTGIVAMFNENTAVVFSDSAKEYGCKNFTDLDTTGEGTTLEYVYLDGVGKPEDFKGVDVKGKVVLLSRGEISFFEKYNAAYDAGALALVVYNNQPGSIGMNLTGKYENADMPAVSISQADALKIKEGGMTGTVLVSSKVATVEAPDGYTMSNFSSYGVTETLELKPEITAPGGNIYATRDGGVYGLMSGTSMAAPSISGQAALVAQYIKAKGLKKKTGLSTRALSQSLLMSTATPLVEADGEAYSPRSQGAGLANANDAIKSPAYILVGKKKGNDGKVKVELKDDPKKTGKYSFSFTVNSLSSKRNAYLVDTEFLTEELVNNYFLVGTDYKLNPSVKLTLSATGDVYDINLDGYVNDKDAKELAKVVAGKDNCVVAKYKKYFDLDKDGELTDKDAAKFADLVAKKKAPSKKANDIVLVKGNKSATVKVTVTLSKADKKYLAQFPNGNYVEGFVYLNGKVNMSVPVMGFYGSWADFSMFDPFDYLEKANKGDTFDPYNGTESNYMEYQLPGSNVKYAYSSNLFAEDEKYIADRNAIAKDGVVAAMDYTLIRNAARVITTVTNAKTGEVYFTKTEKKKYSTYYNDHDASWKNVKDKTEIGWKGTDKKGKALANGTKVNVTVKAIPEYYNGKKASKVTGKGLTFTIPLTVDNTAPKVLEVTKGEAGKLNVTVSDNRYVAAINVVDADKEKVLATYSVNQTKKAAKTTVAIDSVEQVFYVQAVDYAGNTKLYRVNNSGVADTEIVESVKLNETEISMIKGGSQRLIATCAPVQLVDSNVTWTTSDKKVATVDANGIVKAKANGEATITATTNAKNAEGKQLTATCKVTVKSIEKDLNAVVWDENGNVFFSKFNTATLPKYTKVSEKQNVRVLAATEVADGKLFVATGEGDDKTASKLYIVDPAKNYSATEIGEGISECYDLTYSAESNTVYAAYGPYVVKYDAKTGKNLGYLDTADKFAGQIAGLAYAAGIDVSGIRVDYLYVVSTEGELGYVISEVGGTRYGAAKMCNLGVSASANFNSLYFDQKTEMLFWSNYVSGASSAVMYAIEDTSTAEEDSATIYELGAFPSGVWPVCGLH